MKVSVIGAGAIGSMLGGLIKRHHPDVDVVLLVRGEHGRAVHQRKAVTLDGPWGSWDVPIRSSFQMEDVAESTYVLVTVKSHACQQAMQAAAAHLDQATVISIQNGINDDALLQFVPAARLVMGMTATNMAILKPGTVSLQLNGTTVVGPAADGSNVVAARQAADLLRKTGLRIDEHPNVRGVRYNKLAINAVGYASCLSASNFITEAVCHPDWRMHVGARILDECMATYKAAGIKMAKIPGGPDARMLNQFLHLLDLPLAGWLAAAAARQRYNKKPIVFSLYQDLLRGKATEVDHINGEIVHLASLHGREAPFNTLVVDAAHELTHRGNGSFFSREEMIARFKNIRMRIEEPV